MLNRLIDIYTAPVAAFEALRTHAPVLAPLVLLVGASVALNLTYFNLVDPEFIVEDILRQVGDDLTRDDERRIRAFATGEQPGGRWFRAIGGSLALVFGIVLQGAYFSLVSLASGHGIGFRRWLGMVSWASLPGLMAVLGGFVSLWFAPGFEIRLSRINPLTLASLFDIESVRGPSRLLAQIDLTQLWTLVLLIIGYKVWTDRSWVRSTMVAMVPLTLFYGVSLIFFLGRN
ncbi:MAG: YIP1 family protein [Pseudomonadota bacterium]